MQKNIVNISLEEKSMNSQDLAMLLHLFQQDAIIEETSLLPETAGEAERMAYMDMDFSPNFAKFLILAAMLVQDNQKPSAILRLGKQSYTGSFSIERSNPYNYSWFDQESEFNHKTCLDYVQAWYRRSEENQERFLQYYNLAKAMDLDEDMVWDMVQEWMNL